MEEKYHPYHWEFIFPFPKYIPSLGSWDVVNLEVQFTAFITDDKVDHVHIDHVLHEQTSVGINFIEKVLYMQLWCPIVEAALHHAREEWEMIQRERLMDMQYEAELEMRDEREEKNWWDE